MAGLWQRYRSIPLGWLVLIWLAIGIGVGLLLGERASYVAPIGRIFLNLLLMAAVPLVLFNLLDGTSRTGAIGKVGALGVRVLAFFLATTTFALIVGLLLTHALHPGADFELTGEVPERMGAVPAISDVIVGMVPNNIFRALTEGNLVQIVVFAVICGAATILLPDAQRQPLTAAYANIAALLRKVVGIVMLVAPYGVAALAAETAGRYGTELVGSLGLFVVIVWLGHACIVVVYVVLLRVFAGLGPGDFFSATAPVYATSASTCSSLATLVVSLDVAKHRLRLPDSVATFTLSLGAQINKDGTALFFAVVLLFTAQAVGYEFTVAEQATIVLTGLLLSAGVGGIPGGGLVVALILVEAFRLPTEIAIVVAGVYRLVDMGNTTVNCMGDLVATAIFGRGSVPAVSEAG